MNIPGWNEMTPWERINFMATVEKCEVHDYEPVINTIAKESVMQICKNCLDMQGWIYNWDK